MTIVVSVRVNDGIVLAADSATTFVDNGGNVLKVYNNANKIFNLLKGKPIGAMTYGSGSIGKASISTLSKDLRAKFGNAASKYVLDPNAYTMQEVAQKAKEFFEECVANEYPGGAPKFFMGYRLCGYSSGGTLPEAWEIILEGNTCTAPAELYSADNFGPRWAGEVEALDRLILGVGSQIGAALQDLGLDQAQASQAANDLTNRLAVQLYLPAMPIQDAIELARFLADTAAKFTHFSMRAATVGGPIELATITKHEGFKWVTRKHYYSPEFNRGPSDHVA